MPVSVYAKEKVAKEQAQRGKAAEAEVKKYLTTLGNSVAEFDWNRQYDARSAGGRFPSQPGDFQYFRKNGSLFVGGTELERSVNGLIEVKEVDHDFRLPQKNFEKVKIGRLRKRQLAGTDIVILVLHTSTGWWRRPPFTLFERDPAAPSWDLSQWRAYKTLREALEGVEVLRYYGKD